MAKYSDELKSGDVLGKYEIIRELATGGMATIYLARVSGTAGFEKLVVLKCILPNLARDRGFVTMFLDEARIAATLRHSNIADVFDVGVVDNTYFFAMEYVHGQNARAVRIESKQQQMPIPLEVSLAIVMGTASALGYAHERSGPQGPLDLVHRDVSLTNILVSYEGAVKLVDFGIARATLRRGAKTRTGMRRGKAPYMSPEQCRGETVDKRSDLFALGTVMYELTTGQRPFLGNSDFEVMESIVTCQPDPPSVLVRDYPRRLEEIVMRLLTRTPQTRYQSANDIVEDIEAFVANRSMLTSAHVVARYMRELFGEQATVKFERDTITDWGPTITASDAADEEPTAAFRRAEQLWTAELKVKIRTPKAPGEEHTSPFSESTQQNIVLPFDPIDARSEEILADLDDDAPAGETDEARTCRRIDKLLARAINFVGQGEVDKAVTAVELALDEGPRTDEAHQLLQRNVDTIVDVYESMLEDPYRVPRLVRPMHDLIPVEIEPRARLLLPWIDGQNTIKDVIAKSGVQRLEAYHHLCQFLLRGIMQ